MLRATLRALRVGALLATRAAWAATPADSQARWDAWCAWTRRADAPGAPIDAFWFAHAHARRGVLFGTWSLAGLLPARRNTRAAARKAAA